MKKKNLAILIGASAMLLTACTKVIKVTEIEKQTKIETHTETTVEETVQPTGTPTTGTIGETVRIAPEKLEINYNSLTLYVGETTRVGVAVKPIQASATPVSYSSSDESVVTVDANGNITAKGQGEAVVTVTVQGTNISGQIKVASFSKIDSDIKTALSDELAAMKAKQDEKFPNGLSKVECVRYLSTNRQVFKEKKEYIDKDGNLTGNSGTVRYTYSGVERYLVDKEEGFFSVGGYDDTRIIEGATQVRENFDWMFRTNESYITFIFHIAGNSNNYLSVDTSSYIGKDRYTAVEDILNCIFRSGKQLSDNPIDWALSTDALTTRFEKYSSLIASAGKMNNGELVNYVLSQKDYHYTEESVDESDDEIPAGTSVTQNYYERITWKDGYVYSYEVGINEYYTTTNLITGASEFIVEDRLITFDIKVNDDVVYEIPNKDNYTEVADIYDL